MPNLETARTALRAAHEALHRDSYPAIHVTTEDALGPLRERLVGLIHELENVTVHQRRVA